MKTLNAIVKVLTALAAVAGAVYIIATYGEQIVAWAKKTLAALPKCPCCQKEEEESAVEVAEEAPAEEPAEEAAVEVTIEVAAEGEPVAEEADFEA